MILQKATLKKLRELINEEADYRKGPELVRFFNQFGFKDVYAQGFPSRWIYTDEKLALINGTPQIDQCIKVLFSPIDFIGRFNKLDNFICAFNEFLAFDGWKVVRKEKEISFEKAGKIDFGFTAEAVETEEQFLQFEFKDINLNKIGLDSDITEIITWRFEEIKKCLLCKASLSVIFLSGSTLEGILLGKAIRQPQLFNASPVAPKDREGTVKRFPEWTLSNLIDVSHDIGLIKEDVKKFSHTLRGFRNYIHPFQQMTSGFNPDEHTAKISWQVLKAAIFQLS